MYPIQHLQNDETWTVRMRNVRCEHLTLSRRFIAATSDDYSVEVQTVFFCLSLSEQLFGRGHSPGDDEIKDDDISISSLL